MSCFVLSSSQKVILELCLGHVLFAEFLFQSFNLRTVTHKKGSLDIYKQSDLRATLSADMSLGLFNK